MRRRASSSSRRGSRVRIASTTSATRPATKTHTHRAAPTNKLISPLLPHRQPLSPNPDSFPSTQPSVQVSQAKGCNSGRCACGQPSPKPEAAPNSVPPNRKPQSPKVETSEEFFTGELRLGIVSLERVESG